MPKGCRGIFTCCFPPEVLKPDCLIAWSSWWQLTLAGGLNQGAQLRLQRHQVSPSMEHAVH